MLQAEFNNSSYKKLNLEYNVHWNFLSSISSLNQFVKKMYTLFHFFHFTLRILLTASTTSGGRGIAAASSSFA